MKNAFRPTFNYDIGQITLMEPWAEKKWTIPFALHKTLSGNQNVKKVLVRRMCLVLYVMVNIYVNNEVF